ncbi:unnamed protein product [Symbiodinium natans]|uniref:Uncharacterized protein n=1 Tax=Symbiodinium natans TaxID=878477 RepID=A0A812SVV5_9DINO|nr:unnamed protein product [Symbiodinium natans]
MDSLGVRGDISKAIQKEYKSLHHLSNAICSVKDAEAIVRETGIELDAAGIKEQGRLLHAAVLEKEPSVKRSRQAFVQHLLQPRLRGPQNKQGSHQVYHEMIAKDIVLARQVFKSRFHRALRMEGANPHDLEQLEVRKWSLRVAEFVIDANLPASQVVDGVQDPSETWVRLCGGRRVSTLRQTARVWGHFRMWLEMTFGKLWPKDAVEIIDFLTERSHEPCGRTVPGTFLAALSTLEVIGGLRSEDRLSLSPLLISFVRGLETQLSSGAPPRKSAQPYTVAMIIGAELMVMDPGLTVVNRVFAFILLVMVWAALRVDDVQWIKRDSLALSELGLRAVLSRTKTSGPGRKMGELPIFVHRRASWSGVDWLSEGLSLFLESTATLPSELFLGKPQKGGNGFTNRYLSNVDFNSCLKAVLTELPAVRRGDEGGWEAIPNSRLVPEALVGFWSGHSARHNLVSWAGAMRVPPEQRNYLGRWQTGRGSSDTYMITSRQVVLEVQEKVLKGISNGGDLGTDIFVESELVETLVDFSKARGDPSRVKLLHQIMHGPPGKPTLQQKFPLLEDTSIQIGSELGDGDMDRDVVLPEPSDTAPYFVTVSRRTGFKRLHRQGGCPVTVAQVYDARDVWTLGAEVADARCLKCFKADSQPLSSSSGSSSSTSSSDSSLD